MIYYISPYRPDRNIGKTINDNIRQLNAADEDWIVHTDQDVLFLLPDTKQRIETILSATTFDILGAVTNRLGINSQLVQGAFNITDIKEHIRIAEQLQSNTVAEYHDILAAFCLCFRIKTWKQLGGFAENSLSFDSTFSIMAKRSGLKLGLMTGIYVFHLYRMMSDNPMMAIHHLLPQTPCVE